MKYTTTRTQLEPNKYFSHGANLLYKHVDAIIQTTKHPYGVEYVIFKGKATAEQIAKYCK